MQVYMHAGVVSVITQHIPSYYADRLVPTQFSATAPSTILTFSLCAKFLTLLYVFVMRGLIFQQNLNSCLNNLRVPSTKSNCMNGHVLNKSVPDRNKAFMFMVAC